MQAMCSPEVDKRSLAVPHSAFTAKGFEKWMASDLFPPDCRIDLCSGEVLVDMSPERANTHVKLKGGICWVLDGLVRKNPKGEFYGDGVTYTHEASGLVTQPDALYFSFDSFRSGRVEGGPAQGLPLGFRGSVDWILEVVSPSSRTKDRKKLYDAYALAGVCEYWIAEASDDDQSLEIHNLGSDGYAKGPSQDGWQRSAVFGVDVRLERRLSAIGMPVYDLQVR